MKPQPDSPAATTTGPAEHAAQATPPVAGAHTGAPGDGRENLTTFFSIGIVIDILLVSAFLVWAVSQWRKTRK